MNTRDRRAVGTVVVGVDGSPESRTALEYAWRDAARRGARLRVVAVVPMPDYWASSYGPIPLPTSQETIERVRDAARCWTDEVTGAGLGVAAEVSVEVTAVPGSAADVLVAESQEAEVLVLGHRGRGAVAGAVLGSVGMRCVLHATCPVTIVPPGPAPGMPAAVPTPR
jgi:nucleotide-binding universal stress UspA family protein